MARLTEDMIWAVADELDAEGKPTTNAAVRKHLGTGSYSTIGAPMKRWREQKEAAAAPMVEPLPDQLSEVGRAAMSRIWTHAIKTAESRLEEAKAQLEMQREELEKGRQDAEDFAELLNNQLEDAKTELEAERKVRGDLEEDLIKVQEKAAAELASERTRLSDAQQQAATLSGRLEATQAQHDALLARLGDKLMAEPTKKNAPSKASV